MSTRLKTDQSIEPEIEKQVPAKKKEMINNKYQFLYNSAIADGGDMSTRLKTDNTKEAAEKELKQKAENMLPKNWKQTAETEIKAALMSKAEEKLEPEIKKKLKASLEASLLKAEKKAKMAGLVSSYITVRKSKMVASQKKALEENYKHEQMQKAAKYEQALQGAAYTEQLANEMARLHT